MKRILITGANSYIGTALKERLDRSPERYAVSAVSLRTNALDALDFRGTDAVVHAAAIVHRKETAELLPLYDAVNRDLAFAAAKKAKDEGVRQFLFLSTMSVYGMETGTITKDTVAALADETFVVTIVRPPMVFGKGAKGNYRRLESLTKRLPCRPALMNRRSMVSIDTLTAALASRLDAPQSGIFFPQEAQPVSTTELIERIANEQGRTLRATRLLDPAVRLFRACTHSGKKAFGDLVYQDLEKLPLSAVLPGEERP